mgnify:CR=1 FL=1
MALTELVDASLLEFSADYAPLSTIQEPKWRVRALLGKLNADRANGTKYFIPKFGDKIKAIFDGLPKPKDARKFLENDLMLLFTASDVQQFALEHRLNKAQTKAIDALQKAAPDVVDWRVKIREICRIMILAFFGKFILPISDRLLRTIHTVRNLFLGMTGHPQIESGFAQQDSILYKITKVC